MNANTAGASFPRGHRGRPAAGGKYRLRGMKLGSAFFGWMTASGMAVLLTAAVAAVGTALGTDDFTPRRLAEQATGSPTGTGLTSAAILAAVLFVAYYCGGYVAGRMARFDGAKQGLAVWLWAVLMAAVVAALAGTRFNVLANLNSFPQIPVDQEAAAGIIAVVVAALIILGAAVLGGIAGQRYHRKVDQAAAKSA
ncbi:hypothetical protein [Arthrobacter mobilis]|uniref:Uncharacterized protein n=1 Tax=Arthrobacter mobilis TaxID=2724944 RepID=A0A7X6HDS0_9MICC|nr:hypothetical protein [Arthrobacter mobilis]NKX55264.1 hypothetical protein [Arthrobacter mobilis]